MNKEKLKRNHPCDCGSGLKYKRCCLLKAKQAVAEGLLKKRQVTAAVNTSPTARQATALAMANAGIPGDVVFAYLETGLFIRDPDTAAHSPADVAKWQQAVDRYNKISGENHGVTDTSEITDASSESTGEADCRITRL